MSEFRVQIKRQAGPQMARMTQMGKGIYKEDRKEGTQERKGTDF
jgi:hypothetical protein